MDAFTVTDLRSLAERHGDMCVSIFMPTHRGGQETQEDRIRLKNLLKEALDGLVARGVRLSEAQKLFEPAERLVPDGLFWTHKSDGLALFISSESFRYYRLPLSFDQSVMITDRFHVKPLLPVLAGDGHFYLLALGRNKVRFFEGARYSITELDVKAMPKSLADFLKYYNIEKQLQFHTGTSQASGAGQRAATFFGTGAGAEVEKDYLRQYFDQINAGLHEVLRDKRDPLLLAGVEYLLPIYRGTNSYQYLLDEAVLGNCEESGLQELHRQAWPIAQRHFMLAQEGRLAQYEELVGAGRTSNDLREIVPEAYASRIDCLFVSMNGSVCGAFDPATGKVDFGSESEPCDDDLLNLAAVQTILHGGTVYPMGPGRVPGGGPAAAILRY